MAEKKKRRKLTGAAVKNSAYRMKAVEHQIKAMTMRRAGATYEQIGQELKMTTMGAYMAVKVGLEKSLREPGDALRELELQRLDTMMRAVWPQAIRGDLLAVDRVLKISDRRARLLGLDAPTRLAGPSGEPLEPVVVAIQDREITFRLIEQGPNGKPVRSIEHVIEAPAQNSAMDQEAAALEQRIKEIELARAQRAKSNGGGNGNGHDHQVKITP